MFLARTASGLISTLASPLLGSGTSSSSPASADSAANSSSSSSSSSSSGDANAIGGLAQSVTSLSTADGNVDYLAVADYVSNSLNAGIAVAANKVFGYNLEFAVHKQGCVLVTGASSKVGSHAVRTLCSMGYTVFAGVRSLEEGRRLRSKCLRDGSKSPCIPLVIDVTSPQSLREAFEFVCTYIGVVSTDGTIGRVAPDRSIAADLQPAGSRGRSLPTVGEDEEDYSAPVPSISTSPPPSASPLSPPLSPSSANHMRRGHSRLATAAPITAIQEEDEGDEDDDALSVLSRSSSPGRHVATLKPRSDVKQEDLFVGLVNCEGTESPGPLELLPLAELMRCYEINTAGAVAVTQCFLPLLRESKGRIVNVCSSAGITAAPINGSYAASKMALVAVSESLRVELYPFGISVSIIEPGALDATSWSPRTNLSNNLVESDHSLQLRPATPSSTTTSSPIRPPSKSPQRRFPSTTGAALGEEVPYQGPSTLVPTQRRRSSGIDLNSGRPNSPQLFHVHEKQLKEQQEREASSSVSASSYGNGPSYIPVSAVRSSARRNSTGATTGTRRAASLSVIRNPAGGPASSSRLPVPPQSLVDTEQAYSPPPLNARRSASFSERGRDRERRGSATWSSADGLAHELGGSNGGSSTRIRHPTWDAQNLSGTAEELYGPLMATVRDLSLAASSSTASRSSDQTPPHPERKSPRPISTSLPRRQSSSNSSAAQATSPTVQSASSPTNGSPSTPSSVNDAVTSSSRHTSRAISHALTSPFPKTRYRVGWDARATAALRWALPDRVLDWGFAALSNVRQEKDKDV